MLIAYVLSTGPFFWIVSNTEFFDGDYLSDAIGCFYYPLGVIYETESGERLFDWYFGFWE